MKNRTRRRWLRRLAIGLSFATFAAPAAARPDSWVAPSNSVDVATLSTRAILDGHFGQPEAAPVRPDDRANRALGVQQTQLTSNAVRPDDRADRFAILDGSPEPALGGSSVSWDGAVTIGLGSLVLVLVLGLGLGYIRRPRIAGL